MDRAVYNGPKAEKYNEIIDRVNPSEIVTSSVVLYEVYRKVKSLKGEQVALEANAVLSETLIVPLDGTIALEAADYSLEHNLHMADAIIYATARHHHAELFTSDKHMEGMIGVTIL